MSSWFHRSPLERDHGYSVWHVGDVDYPERMVQNENTDGEAGDLERERFEFACAASAILNHGEPIEFHETTASQADLILEHIRGGESARKREAAMKPLAAFIVACSHAQSVLATTLATAINPAAPARVRGIVASLTAERMRSQLQVALPVTTYYTIMLRNAKDIFNKRNKAAHRGLTTCRHFGNGEFEFGLWLVNAKGEHEDIDGNVLRDWTRQAQVVAASLEATTLIVSERIALIDNMTFSELAYLCAMDATGTLPKGEAWPVMMLSEWYPDSTSVLPVHH